MEAKLSPKRVLTFKCSTKHTMTLFKTSIYLNKSDKTLIAFQQHLIPNLLR